LHEPLVWHESLAVHITAVPAHVPFLHASASVQRFESSHSWPSGAGGFEHCPFAGLHDPATWH
jgi:hypothetical protein